MLTSSSAIAISPLRVDVARRLERGIADQPHGVFNRPA
jgi:hypothetical protein